MVKNKGIVWFGYRAVLMESSCIRPMNEKRKRLNRKARLLSDISRRQFLVRSAGIASASMGIRARAGAGDGTELRVGFVGVGDRGMQLLSAALEAPGVRVVAIADALPEARLRARDVVRNRDSGAEPLIAQEIDRLIEFAGTGKIDAVVIATPPFLHRDHAIAALQAGLHVYLEKPLGLSIDECVAVRAEAERAGARGQVFQIGLQRRYNPRYLAGIDMIRSGSAGQVLFVKAQWHNLGNPSRRKSWFYRREKSGDLVLEQATHQMDVFNWVFDAPPSAACGFGGTNRFVDEPDGRSVRDHYGLTLDYPCGGKVNYSHLSYAIPDRRFSGVYELVFAERVGIDLWNGLAWDRSGKSIPLDAPGGSDTRLALEGFFGHIRNGERPAADVDAGFFATAASLLSLKALDTGSVARWNELIV